MTTTNVDLTNSYQQIVTDGNDYAVQVYSGAAEFILSAVAPSDSDPGIICQPGQGVSSNVFGQNNVYAKAKGVSSSTATIIVNV